MNLSLPVERERRKGVVLRQTGIDALDRNGSERARRIDLLAVPVIRSVVSVRSHYGAEDDLPTVSVRVLQLRSVMIAHQSL